MAAEHQTEKQKVKTKNKQKRYTNKVDIQITKKYTSFLTKYPILIPCEFCVETTFGYRLPRKLCSQATRPYDGDENTPVNAQTWPKPVPG